MVEYRCKKCKTIFNKKLHYERHINRKTDCRKDKKSDNNNCEYCDSHFSRKDSLNRHYNICKKNKKNQIIGKNSKFNMKKSKINGRDDNTKISNKKIIDSIINNINGDVNIDNRKFVLVNFPPNEKSVMEVLDKILASDENINIAMVKNVSMNEEKPENHNIYYSDIKASHGEIYTNNRWNNRKIDEILNLLLENSAGNLDKIFKKLGNFLNEETKERIKAGISDFYNTDVRKKIKSYLKVLLYDGRGIVKKTRKSVLDNPIINSDDEFTKSAKCNGKKEVAIYLLKKINIDEEECEIMKYIIKISTDIDMLDIIIRLLCKILYTNCKCKFDRELIDKQISKEKETLKILNLRQY